MNFDFNLVNIINNLSDDTPYRTEELLSISKQIYNLEKNNIQIYECNNFTIKKYYVTINNKQRSYLIKIPKKYDISTINNCIMFFHGSRDLHWHVALLSTNMMSDKFITIYLQGTNQGIFDLEEPHIHKHYKYITYGENFFEIRDFANNFNEDIEYVKSVKNDVIIKYNFTNFYAVGHSNGGVFICLFPIYLSNEFKALVSHQGGIGFDEWFYIPFEKTNLIIKKTPIYFYTGTNDIHKIPCIEAYNIFLNEGFDSQLYIENGLNHNWNKNCEDNIFSYLLKY